MNTDGFAKSAQSGPMARSFSSLTSRCQQRPCQHTIKDGFNGFICKPLDPDRFPAQITRILEDKSVWEWR